MKNDVIPNFLRDKDVKLAFPLRCPVCDKKGKIVKVDWKNKKIELSCGHELDLVIPKLKIPKEKEM